MDVLARFGLSFGRMGNIDGLFVTTLDEVERAIGKDVDLGESLGKHSEVVFEIGPKMIEVISDDQSLIASLVSAAGGTTICGYNVLEYLAEQEAEDDDEDSEDNEG